VAVACGQLGTDLDRVVAIDIFLPDSARIEATDTLVPSARALNGRGDSVAAQVFWTSFDTALVRVLDSATGVSLARAPGVGRLQAHVGNLRSNPQNVFVLPLLDSARAGGPTRDTVRVTPPDTATAADSLSDSLLVQVVAAAAAAAAGTDPLRGRRVVFVATIFPAGGATVTFVPDTAATVDTVKTNSSGIAVAQLRFVTGPVPDSVVVRATVRRFDGSLVPDSVRFVVEFRP
jgi:hypothetical protein